MNTLSHHRVLATVLRLAVASIRTIRCVTPVVVVTILVAVVGCSESNRPSTTPATTSATALPPPQPASNPAQRRLASDPAQWRLASDPAHLAGDLVADEQALRDPSSSEAVLMAAARRQQAAYRALGRHPEWDPIARPRIPPSLLEVYDRNVDARRQLTAMSKDQGKDTLPVWRIDPPPPADELLGYYREAESVSGVGWTYLAAINLIETGFGRVAGVSTAGAQGPMQFLPSTFAAYGEGAISSRPTTASWPPAATSPLTASLPTATTPCTGTTTPTNTCRRSTTTRRCSQPIRLRLPATTGGTSITTRLPVTWSCRSVTPRPHRSASQTTWRPIRGKAKH